MAPSAAQLAEKIEKIVDSAGSKADRARQLFRLGCDRTDVVELLDMSYSQAHSIWKQMQAGQNGEAWEPSYRGKAKASHVEAEARRQNNLRLSPTQVRYITQDGHRIVRVDKQTGPECRNCGRALDFSLKWLGFVHRGSTSEPTDIEDRYPE